MRILWITNTIFPEPSKALGIDPPVFGGWMYNWAKQIAGTEGYNLAVATSYLGDDIKKFEINGIMYYLLPSKSTTLVTYKKGLEPFWQKIIEELSPNLVHIHGTEFSLGLSCMRICPSLKFIISVQGLTSVCARYFYAGIEKWEIVKNITFRDIVRKKTVFQVKEQFEKRGNLEKEYIRRSEHVIGRTHWDYAHAKAINPNLTYHFCNETLRESFYTAEKWDSSNKKDYTIFLSQAGYPIKGLHQVLKAVALLIGDFPEIRIRVAGDNIFNNKGFIKKIRLGGYGAYINSLIKSLHLYNHVKFIGPLNEEQMVKEYRMAHLFVCPSSIENSPNSLGEAQLLGVPTVSSYVGGIPDMVSHGESGLLYRFEEIEMLAEQIRQIFTDPLLADRLSKGGIKIAEQRHDSKINLRRTFEIYNSIIPVKECIQ